MKTIYHIYHKIFKKILTLSSTAVTGLINGLFDTNYPPDSVISYNWTEFHGESLRRTLADTIVTINGMHSYHMEAQISENDEIIFRVFDYSYNHAKLHASNAFAGCELSFPEPKIIYLCSTVHTPDVYTLNLNFGSQGSFTYQVSTFKFLETSLEDLNREKMIILIPFQLLRLRNKLSEKRSKDNLEEVNMLTDQSLMLDIDYIEERHEKEIEQIIAEKDSIITQKVAEIASLKSQLAQLHTS